MSTTRKSSGQGFGALGSGGSVLAGVLGQGFFRNFKFKASGAVICQRVAGLGQEGLRSSRTLFQSLALGKGFKF